MAVFQLLESKLRGKVLYSRCAHVSFRIMTVEMLTEETEPRDHTAYITGEKTAATVIQKRKGSFYNMATILLVSARPSKNMVLKDLAEKYNLSMIVAELSECELSLCVAQTMNYYLSAEYFLDAARSSPGLLEMVEKLAGYLGEEVLLLNSFGSVMFQSPSLSKTRRKEMETRYYTIISQTADDNLASLADGGDRPEYLYMKLHQNQNMYGVLFISLANGIPHDYEWLMKKLLPCMSRVVFANTKMNPNVPPKFSLIWKDIMEGKYSSSEELKKRFIHSGYKINTFFRLMVVQLNQPAEQMEYIFLQIYPILKQLFPDSLLTLYLGTIVVLNWEEQRNYQINISGEDLNRLEELLREYNGWICVGWGSRNLTWLPPLYRFSQKILNMRNQILQAHDSTRMIPFSAYCPFLVVDMCAQHLRNTADIRDIMLMCHPAVINLFRYDMIHNTNLEMVLFHYLINHRSLEQTAASLYMHRNTVVNKIRKIRSMVSADLDDPQIQPHLIFSHFVLRYCVNIIDPNFVNDQQN